MNFSDYVGIPYKEGGDTLAGFNCWGLLRHIQEVHFGVIIPEVPISDPIASAEWFRNCCQGGNIEQVQFPFHGCPVLLRGGDLPHVGVYLDLDGGGVIHALEEAGVIFTPRHELRRAGYTRVKFYKYSDERTTGNPQEPVSDPPGC
jgi:cell wall-associated NlpC family hydrolase